MKPSSYAQRNSKSARKSIEYKEIIIAKNSIVLKVVINYEEKYSEK